MKTVYLDLLGGISGDMTVAAFIDMGVSLACVRHGLAKIALDGYAVKTHRVQRGHGDALRFDVVVRREKNFSYREIMRLIKTSRLGRGIQERMVSVYETLKDAEGRVHGHAHHDMRFHQLGEIDSFVDIAAACICMDACGASRLLYSVIPLGLKIAPAVSAMLEGQAVYFTSWPFENVTPTGLAILRALGTQISKEVRETFVYGRCGYGAGMADPPGMTNVLRMAELDATRRFLESDTVLVLEADIDDTQPQIYAYVCERLLEAGALDVCLQNVIMKKSRPGILLTVLSDARNFDKISDIIFRETTTIGLRYYPVSRIKLPRSCGRVRAAAETVRVKTVVLPDGSRRSFPEYEDCLRAAKRTGRPLQEIMELARKRT